MDWRMFIESWIIIACGLLLLSPIFNTLFSIPVLSMITHVSKELISHLAIALIPIIIVCTIEMIQGHD